MPEDTETPQQVTDQTESGGVADTEESSPRLSRWQRWARWVGLAILVVVSAHGIRQFMAGDATAVTEYWSQRYLILPLVLFFGMMDLAIEMTAWTWVFHRFGMRSRDLTGVAAGLSGKAGLLLPAQLGRLIRPDLMVRLGRGSLADCLKAEAVVFVLDTTSVLALFAALVAYRVHPGLSLVAGATVIGAVLYLGNRVLKFLSGTTFDLPQGFWWKWETFAIVV
ncbi:MAG: hypothetical protein GY906_40030, partial [bacterium]|nr:hypothetical protein [bacterium]